MLSILKNKKVLFLKKYDLGRSVLIGQESSNRWRFAVPILIEGFALKEPKTSLKKQQIRKFVIELRTINHLKLESAEKPVRSSLIALWFVVRQPFFCRKNDAKC